MVDFEVTLWTCGQSWMESLTGRGKIAAPVSSGEFGWDLGWSFPVSAMVCLNPF
jgi:hypothetical protein